MQSPGRGEFTPQLGLDQEAMNQFRISLSNNNDERITSEYKKYKGLDEKIRTLNGGRTNGLLTGTLISRFIAEALLTRIDKEIESNGISFVRYVDDYEVFIYNENEIENITSKLTDIIVKYHFTFNQEKTRYVAFPYYAIENLEKIYNKYCSEEVDSAELIELFNKYFNLERDGTKGAIRYLIKSIDHRLKVKNYDLYASLLLNVLVNDNRSLIKVCELLIKKKKNININRQHIEIIKKLLHQYISAKKIWRLFG